MAYFSFSEKISSGQPISIFNNGNLQRDFTYIDDITDAIERLVYRPIAETPSLTSRYRILNIGHSDPVVLDTFIRELENQLQMEAIRINKPMQPGDVLTTYADVSSLENLIGHMKKNEFSRRVVAVCKLVQKI